MPDCWVIKLGGSLFGNPLLNDWLIAISEHGKGRVVVVPGGGPFADAVRQAQKQMGFDDMTAHRMAMLAMEQSAVMLANLHVDFIPAKNQNEIQVAWKNKKIPLWLPTEMALAVDDIPASWDMTSDSLAAWLAAQIGASHLLLVKSCAVPGGGLNLPALAQQKIVDPLLPMFATKGRLTVRLLSAGDSLSLSTFLSNETARDYL
jgi:5-(aminomethyl)-3-furanmethanol phosphate kinase